MSASVVGFGGLAAAILAAGAIALWAEPPVEFCRDDAVREVLAPDGESRALVTVRDCGATTTWTTHLLVQRRTPSGWAGVEPVFVGRPGPGMTAGPAHSVPLTLAWRSARRLEVRHDTRVEVVRAEAALAGAPGVTVTYVRVPRAI